MQPLWATKRASHQLVRDDSCSHFLWSTPVEQSDCSKTQNKPCRGPGSRALHIHSPVCPWASLLTICAALCTRPHLSTPKKGSTSLLLALMKTQIRLCSLTKLILDYFLLHLHLQNFATWWQKIFTGLASAWESLGQAWMRGTMR